MGRDPRGGYTSGPKPVRELTPPPKGPGVGMPECVLCGRPATLAVLCRECLALKCTCGHFAGDHVAGRCLVFPACPCLVLEVTSAGRRERPA